MEYIDGTSFASCLENPDVPGQKCSKNKHRGGVVAPYIGEIVCGKLFSLRSTSQTHFASFQYKQALIWLAKIHEHNGTGRTAMRPLAIWSYRAMILSPQFGSICGLRFAMSNALSPGRKLSAATFFR